MNLQNKLVGTRYYTDLVGPPFPPPKIITIDCVLGKHVLDNIKTGWMVAGSSLTTWLKSYDSKEVDKKLLSDLKKVKKELYSYFKPCRLFNYYIFTLNKSETGFLSSCLNANELVVVKVPECQMEIGDVDSMVEEIFSSITGIALLRADSSLCSYGTAKKLGLQIVSLENNGVAYYFRKEEYNEKIANVRCTVCSKQPRTGRELNDWDRHWFPKMKGKPHHWFCSQKCLACFVYQIESLRKQAQQEKECRRQLIECRQSLKKIKEALKKPSEERRSAEVPCYRSRRNHKRKPIRQIDVWSYD